MVRSGKNGDLHLKQIAYYKRTGEYHPTTLPKKKLFYVGKDRKQSRLVIVSEEEKKKVLRECHENDTGAHHGISRTLTLVESNYYWTSVTNDVKQWVYSCQHCQVAKNTVILAPKQHLLKVENPWSIVTVDLLGPFHTSHGSHVYAIIMTDLYLFTKWVVILPLCDVSASEISKAIISIFFLYGPPQKVIMDQRDEFIQQINVELCGLFGTKQIVIPHASGTVNPTESTPTTIKTFLSKHCADHPNNWDDHLAAVSFAFNVIHLEPSKSTPYFQMFNRNPCMPDTSDTVHEVDGDNTRMFTKILDAIKEADKIMENDTTSVGQMENNHSNELNKSKITIKKKPKQLNPFHLKVGHEVLRQRKNWWKDGRFQSEWVGPCVIDHITESGCAVLRDNTGARLKRPIKMSHLKPYMENNHSNELNKSKITIKKKPKQLNPFHLKVGHEVLRQRKNWWKDGRFQSEWVGPCVIDHITESGCAVLRDNTGARLKRPIKMSHLKPYVRESNEQDSLYLLQGAVVADHDYLGLPEIPVGAYQTNILVEDAAIGGVDHELLASSKDRELLEYRNAKISPLIEDHTTLEKQTQSAGLIKPSS
ncbi:Gypsy retrotransposon integrase-like protein 1 [Tupaia chinensis]|uniref:Gypsy retrotransposon integrase-like protein 1 n=1 Tax=Tupaia chinensis TaxID=246437 RepID=L9LD06_TUPCH|nr:Gypsy retrotransposon integrase-like protein 1 [Tupaia chinensis]